MAPKHLNIKASANGSTNNGKKLNMDKHDRLEDADGKRLKDLPSEDGTYGSARGAQVLYSLDAEAGVASFTGSGSWNTVKTFKIGGNVDKLNGNALHLSNFVDANVNLKKDSDGITDTDLNITIDGAKRGSVNTGDGNDVINVGVSSNGGWDETFNIKSGGGDDTITFTGASEDGVVGWGSNYTDGHSTKVVINAGDGNDVVDTSALDASNNIRGGEGNDTITTGGGNDIIRGDDGNDVIDAGAGDDTVWGGEGDDTFVIGDHDGSTTTIKDFTIGEDILDLSVFAVGDFANLSFTKQGNKSILDLGDGQTVVLHKVDFADLTADDFAGLEYEGDVIIGTEKNDINYVSLPHNLTPTVLQYADIDADGQMEITGLYGDQVWSYDVDRGWELQQFAESPSYYQFVNTDGDAALEFYGVYDGQLWLYNDNVWTYQDFAGTDVTRFQFADTDNDTVLEYHALSDGALWQYDDNTWTREYFAGNPDFFQFVNADADAALEFFGTYGGQVWEYDDAAWSRFYEVGSPEFFNLANVDADMTLELIGRYGEGVLQVDFAENGMDVLVGAGGNDTINGLSGDDTLTGNGGSDMFVFDSDFGNDVITDFADGDVLDFNIAGIDDAADVLANTTYVGGNAIIDIADHGTVTLEGVTSLDADDFIF